MSDEITPMLSFKGHVGPVYSVCFSPDGKLALSGAYDRRLRLWDVATGENVRTLEGHVGPVWSVCFSPDGKLVLSGSEDKTLRLWDVATGENVRTLEGHVGTVYSVCFSPDGKQALSGSGDQTLCLWDVETGETVQTLTGYTEAVWSVCFSPDGKLVLSGTSSNTLRLWDVATGENVRTLEGHVGTVYSVCFSPDGKQALSGSLDGALRLWDVVTGETIRTLEGHANSIFSVCFSPDGKQALSGAADRTLRLWDVETGETIRTLEGHANSVYSVCFSPDGKLALSGAYNGTLLLWDLSMTIAKMLDETLSDGVKSEQSIPPQNENTVNATSEAGHNQSIAGFTGHASPVESICFSPDGKLALSASRDLTLRLWDVSTGENVQTLTGHVGPVRSVCFSPDGKLALSGSDDGTLRLWDVSTGETTRTMEGHSGPVWSVCFSPDGKLVLSGASDTMLLLWDVVTGKNVRTLEGHASPVESVCFSPDSKLALSGSLDNTLRLWDVSTGETIRTMEGHVGTVWSVCFSPDGKLALSGSDEGMIRLWDVATGKTIRTLKGHANSVYSVCFSPDGKLALSGSRDGTLRLWDVVTGENVRTLEEHAASVLTVYFSPDGRLALSGSGDNMLRLWMVTVPDNTLPRFEVTVQGAIGAGAVKLREQALKIGEGLANAGVGIRTNGSSGVATYVVGAARQTLVQKQRDPFRFLRNIVRDYVPTRRFEERVASEMERTERLLEDSKALILIGNPYAELLNVARQRGLLIIPVPGTSAERHYQSLLNDETYPHRERMREAAELLASGTAEEIGLRLPALLADVPPNSEEEAPVAEAPGVTPMTPEPEIVIQEHVRHIVEESVRVIREHAEEIHASTLDVHLMADPRDPFFTCLTFRDRQTKTPVFFEGRLELPKPPDEVSLFAAVFNDDKPASLPRLSTSGELKQAFHELMGHIREENGERLHIHLRVNNNVLPLHETLWEWMQEDEGKEPIAVSAMTPFARALHTSKAALGTLPLGEGERLRLLLVRSSPSEPCRLSPTAEQALEPIPAAELTRLHEALMGLDLPVDITMLGGTENSVVTLEQIRERLTTARDVEGKPYHLLYLLCHGVTRQNCGELLLGNEFQNETKIREHLAEFLLRGVVLASCWTAAATDGDALKGVGRSLVDAGIPAVIAMQEALEYPAACIFAQRFLADLVRHGEADVAVNAARRALWLKRQRTYQRQDGEIGSRQWGAPVLFLRYQNGPLWTWDDDAAPPPIDPQDIRVPEYPKETGTELATRVLERFFSQLPFPTEHLVQTLREALRETRREPDGGEPPQCWKPETEPTPLTDKANPHHLTPLKISIRGKYDLDYGDAHVIEQALAALHAGMHVIFCGPPGTGKTTLAGALSEYAKECGYCNGYITVTATADWTTADTVGGYMPDSDHRLVFRPGLIPRAIKEGKWVVLDEINRADIDKAFGELFTLLSGQGITLPYEVGGLPVRIRPEGVPLDGIGWDYVANRSWRILGTMNVFDKASLYSMSLAFQRRFAFIHVPLPDDRVYRRILYRNAGTLSKGNRMALYRLFLAEHGDETITPMRRHRALGPAIALDLLKYLEIRGGHCLHEAIALYVVPQMEGLDDTVVGKIYQYLKGTVLRDSHPAHKEFVCQRIQEMYPFKDWENK